MRGSGGITVAEADALRARAETLTGLPIAVTADPSAPPARWTEEGDVSLSPGTHAMTNDALRSLLAPFYKDHERGAELASRARLLFGREAPPIEIDYTGRVALPGLRLAYHHASGMPRAAIAAVVLPLALAGQSMTELGAHLDRMSLALRTHAFVERAIAKESAASVHKRALAAVRPQLDGLLSSAGLGHYGLAVSCALVGVAASVDPAARIVTVSPELALATPPPVRRWILAHEISHVVLGHAPKEDAVTAPPRIRAAAAAASRRQEFAADLEAVRLAGDAVSPFAALRHVADVGATWIVDDSGRRWRVDSHPTLSERRAALARQLRTRSAAQPQHRSVVAPALHAA